MSSEMTGDVQVRPSLTSHSHFRVAALVSLVQLAIVVLVLNWLGRLWWCPSGDAAIWISSSASAHTSQHLFDPYSFSHVCHGLIFAVFLAFVRPSVSVPIRFTIAMALEGGWEILENTPLVIQRYRDSTAALGYQGDSIVNSIADILSCAVGFLIATRIGWRYTLALIGCIELVMLSTIRDSLLLNVIMLCYPVDAIRQWQLSPAN